MANTTTSIVLGIFVGIGATLSLGGFLDFEILKWIGSSLGVILFSLLIIYLMAEESIKSSSLMPFLLKIFTIIVISFFPFTLQKVIGEYSYPAPPVYLPIHASLIGIMLFFWGLTDKSLEKEKSMFSWIVGLIAFLVGLIWSLMIW